jgi:hypothetical protein
MQEEIMGENDGRNGVCRKRSLAFVSPGPDVSGGREGKVVFLAAFFFCLGGFDDTRVSSLSKQPGPEVRGSRQPPVFPHVTSSVTTTTALVGLPFRSLENHPLH